jgi:hypothetical protein
MEATDLGTILSALARQASSARLEYPQLVDQLRRLGERKADAALLRLVKNHIPDLIQLLGDLERAGAVNLMREGGTVRTVEVASYFGDAIRSVYAAMADSATTPFPDRDALGIEVPPGNLLVADIKQDFGSLLRQQGRIPQEIVRINFPEGIDHLYVPAETIGPKLMELAVAKLGLYVQDARNLGYITNKLRSILTGADLALTNALNDVITRPGKAAQTLLDPGDFTLKFWTHFASLVLQDLTKKKDKTRDDQSCCQAAYLIGHYVVYQRGVQQREQERTTDTKRMDAALKKPPYAFTLEDIFALKDTRGVPFSKKHTRQFVVEFLQARIHPDVATRLPPLVRLKTGGKAEYFIAREFVAPLASSRMQACAGELRGQYVDAGMDMLRSGERNGPLADEERFAQAVRGEVQASYPLQNVLLSPDLLFLAKEEIERSSPVRGEIEGWLTGARKLKPVHEILGLDRRKLLREAGALLPPWYTMPVIRQLFFLFRRIFRGGGGGTSGAEKGSSAAGAQSSIEGRAAGARRESPALGTKQLAAPAPSAPAAYKAAMKVLIQEIAGGENRVDRTLAELAEKWNPLVDEVAKRNLVADVDSYIRDFVRSLRKGFRVKPPDAPRIRRLAEELAQKNTLSQIRRKDQLQRYIEVYMVRLLLRR